MKTLRIKIEEKICYLGLNRPEKANSMTKEMVQDLISFFDTTKSDRNFRVVVLYGEGGVFSSGGCLEWMRLATQQTENENLMDASLFVDLFGKMKHYPKPIVASIEGVAMGGALGLIACCDMAIAEEGVRFAFKEVRVGLVAGTIAPYVLQRIGASASRYLLLTGVEFTTHDALRYQLITNIAPPKRLKETTRDVCRQLLAASPLAVNKTKELITVLEEGVVKGDELNEITKSYIALSRTSPDGIEGVNAFFEQRKPIWRDAEETK